MPFTKDRRQRFLNESLAKEREDDLTERISSFSSEIENPDLLPRARASFAWKVASASLERLILRYTAGTPVLSIANDLPEVIAAFARYDPLNNPVPSEARALTITQLEAYVYVFWLLSLCRMLGHGDLVGTVLGWLEPQAEFNRGRDGLFESVVGRLAAGGVPTERVLLFPDAYRPLAKATISEDASERAGLVKVFLDGWYKSMKPCYWYGTHADKEGSSYFGYWSFEAALVTFLWDIDDTSYRDHLVYPKDLVAFARERFPYEGPVVGGAIVPTRCLAGQPCPREGFWFSPASADSRRFFKAGEVMPYIGGDYGATIWQWDDQQ